jgi:hypothetical protein
MGKYAVLNKMFLAMTNFGSQTESRIYVGGKRSGNVKLSHG